jgi:hypothetical protein
MGLLDPLFNHVLSGFGVQQEDPQGALLSEFLRLPQQPAQAPAQQPLPTGHMMPQTQQAAQQARPMAPPEPNLLDRIGAMARGYGTGGIIGGVTDAINLGNSREERAAQQQRNHTIELLVRQGKLDPETAQALAGADPNLRNQYYASAFTTKPPVMHDFEVLDPSTGEKIKVPHQYVNGGWVRAGAGGTAPQASAPDNSSAGGPVSPIMAPPVPPGVNPGKFREEAAKQSAKDLSTIQEKGLGSIDFLKRSARAKEQITSAGDDLFGPLQGTEAWNTFVRAPASALPNILGGGTATENSRRYTDLNAMYKDLSSSFLKARFGSANLSDADRRSAEEMTGGLRSADAKSAKQVLDNLDRESFDNIQKAVQARTLDPRAIPPEIIQRGIEAGVLDPALFGVQPSAPQPKGATPANPGSGGWVDAGGGVMIRAKQ